MPTKRELPVWRSLLFVPANNDRFVSKAPAVGADALILDLEDSVGPADKPEARRELPGVARRLAQQGIEVVVRINRSWRQAILDLEVAVDPNVTAIMCPKVDSAAHVREMSETIAEFERERSLPEGRIKLMLIVETAEGYLNMREIANADARAVSLSLGSEDFGLSMGMTSDSETLYAPKQQVVACARAAGITPMGFVGSIADFKDIEGLRQIVRRSKKMGLQGATCIHPNQVKVCNEEFGPTPAEIESARKIVDAYDIALKEGRGSIQVEGKMVDIPVALRAKDIIKLADAIAARATRAN